MRIGQEDTRTKLGVFQKLWECFHKKVEGKGTPQIRVVLCHWRVTVTGYRRNI